MKAYYLKDKISMIQSHFIVIEFQLVEDRLLHDAGTLEIFVK